MSICGHRWFVLLTIVPLLVTAVPGCVRLRTADIKPTDFELEWRADSFLMRADASGRLLFRIRWRVESSIDVEKLGEFSLLCRYDPRSRTFGPADETDWDNAGDSIVRCVYKRPKVAGQSVRRGARGKVIGSRKSPSADLLAVLSAARVRHRPAPPFYAFGGSRTEISGPYYHQLFSLSEDTYIDAPIWLPLKGGLVMCWSADGKYVVYTNYKEICVVHVDEIQRAEDAEE